MQCSPAYGIERLYGSFICPGLLLVSEREFLGREASTEYLVLFQNLGKMVSLNHAGPLEKASSGSRVRFHMTTNSSKRLRTAPKRQTKGGKKTLHSSQDNLVVGSALSWGDDIRGFSFLPADGSSFGQIVSGQDETASLAYAQELKDSTPELTAMHEEPSSITTPVAPKLAAKTISMVIYILDMCGQGGGPVGSTEDVEGLLFHNDLNLADYFDSCSNGRAKVSPDDTLVISVSMPCSGTTSGLSWSVSKCTPFDYYGWQLWLMEWSESHGIDVSPYTHHVAILPRNHTSFMLPVSECSFTGIGVVGPVVSATSYTPGVFSFAWIAGDYWDQPQSWMHEIGHNYFLRHSNTAPEPSQLVCAVKMETACILKCGSARFCMQRETLNFLVLLSL